MNVKTYILVFFNPNINIETLNRWVVSSPYILSYWNYLPLVYCFKSAAPVNELRVHFEPIVGMNNFLIAEINTDNISGRLPPEAWPWFQLSSFPPVPPAPGAFTPPTRPSRAKTLIEHLRDTKI